MRLSSILAVGLATIGIVFAGPVSSNDTQVVTISSKDTPGPTATAISSKDTPRPTIIPLSSNDTHATGGDTIDVNHQCMADIHWVNYCLTNGKMNNTIILRNAYNQRREPTVEDGRQFFVGNMKNGMSPGPWALQGGRVGYGKWDKELIMNAHDDQGQVHLSFWYGDCNLDTINKVVSGPAGCMTWVWFNAVAGPRLSGKPLSCDSNGGSGVNPRNAEFRLEWMC